MDMLAGGLAFTAITFAAVIFVAIIFATVAAVLGAGKRRESEAAAPQHLGYRGGLIWDSGS